MVVRSWSPGHPWLSGTNGAEWVTTILVIFTVSTQKLRQNKLQLKLPNLHKCASLLETQLQVRLGKCRGVSSKNWGNLCPRFSFDVIGDLGVLGGWSFSPRLFFVVLISPCRLSYSAHMLSSLPCLVLPAGSPWRGELDKISAP